MKAVELAKAFGYMTEAEVYLLKASVLTLKETYPVLVNIGAGAGTSTLAMREAWEKSIIYSVDISPGGPLGGLEGERNAFDGAELERPVQILADSEAAAQRFKDVILRSTSGRPTTGIDLLFIDDGHEEKDVIRDIEKWTPMLSDGGLVLFHDYGAERWPAVKQVVDKYAKERRWILHGLVDTLIVFRVEND